MIGVQLDGQFELAQGGRVAATFHQPFPQPIMSPSLEALGVLLVGRQEGIAAEGPVQEVHNLGKVAGLPSGLGLEMGRLDQRLRAGGRPGRRQILGNGPRHRQPR